MIQPNTLSDPGLRAAEARVDAILTQLDATPESVLLTFDAGKPPAQRAAAVDRVRQLAVATGRAELLAEALERATAALENRRSVFYYRYRASVAQPIDIAAVSLALMDLVAAAVVEDRLDSADYDMLAASGEQLLGLYASGSGTQAQPPAPTPSPTPLPYEPTEQEWADADAGPAAVDPDASVVGSRRTWAGVIAAPLAVGSLLVGFAAGNIAMGVAGAAIAVLLAWTFATGRSSR